MDEVLQVDSGNALIEHSGRSDGPMVDRGHLDLAVELSTRDVTAGEQFTVFVVVRNPFVRPVWIQKVHVSLPSELYLAERKAILRASIWRRWFTTKNRSLESDNSGDQLIAIRKSLEKLGRRTRIANDEAISKSLTETKERLRDLERTMEESTERPNRVHFSTEGDTSIRSLKIGAKVAHVSFGSTNTNRADLDTVEILDPLQVRQMTAVSQEIELESSLPHGAALQPGSTVVFSARLDTLRSVLFTPSKYRLNFNIVYSFKAPTPSAEGVFGDGRQVMEVFQNTIPYELLLRASVFSILSGSVWGGLFGSVARVFQTTPKASWTSLGWPDLASDAISVLLAIILSAAAIVFVARKSDAQSFVSVEDFWGGLLTGFLVGYTGTSFFENLVGYGVNGRIGG